MENKFCLKKAILLLISAVCCISLCACSDGGEASVNSNAEITVMSYEGTEISSGLYSYILSSKKTDFLYILESNYGSGFATDSDSFWNTVPNDGDSRSYGERVVSDINDYCRMLLVADKLCANYSVSLSDEYKEEISATIDENVFYYGDEENFEKTLRPFGLDIEALADYYEREYKIVALTETLYGNGGVYQLSSDEVNAATSESYVKLKHVYYAGEDKKALEDKANDLVNKLNADEVKFEDLQKETEDDSYESYPDGYIVELDEYELSGLKLEEGDFTVSAVEGGVYIIARVPLSDSDLSEYYEATEASLINDSFYELVKQYFPLIEINHEELDKYDIVTAEVFER